jgi:protein-L-isoaspartate(D-aspartate) O-methyltransferase
MERKKWDALIEKMLKEKTLRSHRVVRAMRLVNRLDFVPESVKSYTDVDMPLSIGFGQTISAPHRDSVNAILGETWFQ